jgi:hypothetical protein
MSNWLYPPTQQTSIQGRVLAEDNFAQEWKTSSEIFSREGFQNPLDASDGSGPVRIKLRLLRKNAFDVGYLKSVLGEDYVTRLVAAGGDAANLSEPAVLVLEDFGTTGLLGTYTDSTVDGPQENWNAFWFREGEGAKSGATSNGRAGQGKITFYQIGAARAVFGLTTRKSDSATLLMGRSSFRKTYVHKAVKYDRDAFWCVYEGGRVLPFGDVGQVAEFKNAFGLERDGQSGLSIVIPYPIQFSEHDALVSAVSEFYYPIARGRLEVTVAGVQIDASNLDFVADKVFPDDLARKKGSAFTKGYRAFVRGAIEGASKNNKPVELKTGWEKTPAIEESAFPDTALASCRDSLLEGKRVWVRCPLTVKPRKGATATTHFDVYLEVPEELERVEETYIRGDLVIGSETHLSSSTHLQRARALTLAEDPAISGFLADAEEPTHLKWNASRPRLAEDYYYPREIVRAVRKAAPRLLTTISGGAATKDLKVLAKYFTKAADEGANVIGPGKCKTKEPPVPPPPPRLRKFKLSTGADWVQIAPVGNLSKEDLPEVFRLEVAYEGLDQDPFAEYDPFDFDLGDEKAFRTKSNGVIVDERTQNRVIFHAYDPKFFLTIHGFDANIRLRARLNYTEKSNAGND